MNLAKFSHVTPRKELTQEIDDDDGLKERKINSFFFLIDLLTINGNFFVQLVGIAEYTDCLPAESKSLTMSILFLTINNLMVRFGECKVPFHCHHSQLHSGPEW